MKKRVGLLSWKEFIIHTTNEAEEAVANILNEAGANGVAIDNIQDVQRQRENKFGEILEIDVKRYPDFGIRVKGYFFEDEFWPEKKQILQEKISALNKYGIETGNLKFVEKTVEEKDWENEWKKYFTIQKVTNQIVIVPDWEHYEAKDNELIIKIDPGMAFGTGTHPTTILSLKALEKCLRPHDTVIDVGSGSGILSIAAILLGANHVHAYDLDPVAIKSAKMNQNLNQLNENITVEQHDLLKGINHQVNIIVSNILAEILIDLVDDAWNNLYDQGYFITSGIIKTKKELVKKKLIETGFTIIETKQYENWISIIAQKRIK